MLGLLLLELVTWYKLQSYFVSLLLTLSLRILSADDTSDLSTISKNSWSLNFHCHTRFYQEKCIQMSTNKPSILLVQSRVKIRNDVPGATLCTLCIAQSGPWFTSFTMDPGGHFKLTRANMCAEWVKCIIIAENLIFSVQYAGATFISKVSLS